MTADPNLRDEFGAGILGAFRWCRRGSHEALPGGPEVRLRMGDYDISQHVEAVGAEGIRINSIAAAQVDTLLSGVRREPRRQSRRRESRRQSRQSRRRPTE